MVRNETFEYLSGWLSDAMESGFKATRKPEYKTKTLIGLGRAGKRSDWIETVLGDLFEQHLCLDKERRVLVGEDGATLYAFNGKYYEQIDVQAQKFVTELVKRTMRALKIGSMYVQKCPDVIAKSIVSTLTSSDEYLYKPERRYIAFNNCVFDLRDGKPKQFSLRYKPFIALGIDYMSAKEAYKKGSDDYGVGDNPCRLWDTKIKEIIPNDDARDAFQQFCGSLLIDRHEITIEYIAYLVGSGSNGKSVAATTIANVFGNEYFSRFSLRQLFKDNDARANIAALDGKICNLVGDLQNTEVSGGDFKRAVSGEWFQGRRNYKDPIMVKFPPLLCCANEMFQTSDDTWGHHRRQLPIYTTTRQWTDEDKDPMLTQKLAVPLARVYIFSWIYEGFRKIMRNKGNIVLGEDVVKAQKRLMARSSSGRCWWDDKGYVKAKPIARVDTRWRSIEGLFQEYKTYATGNGYEKQMSKAEISAMLRNIGFKDKETIRRIGHGVEYCVGVIGVDSDEYGNLKS